MVKTTSKAKVTNKKKVMKPKQANKRSSKTSTSKRSGPAKIKLALVSRKVQALLVVLAVALIGGGYFLYQSLAATAPDYRVRFIAVIPKGQSVPSWATSAHIKSNAQSMSSWFTKQVGKSFLVGTGDPLNYQVRYGSKTISEYMTCPSDKNCLGYDSNAIAYNLSDEFAKPGYATVVFFRVAPPLDGGTYSVAVPARNVQDTDGYVKSVGSVAVQFAGSSSYIGDALSRRYGSHELGHAMGLGHVCDYTLMSAGGGKTLNGVPCKVATSWPYTTLDRTQAATLSKYSPFFNSSGSSTTTTTTTTTTSSNTLFVNNSDVRSKLVSIFTEEGCNLTGRVWKTSTSECAPVCLFSGTSYVSASNGRHGYCTEAIQINGKNYGYITQSICNDTLGRRFVSGTGCSRKVNHTTNVKGALQCILKAHTYYVKSESCKP